MRARETASRQDHQPLPAHLDASALLALRFMSGCEEFDARFIPSLREGVKKTLRDWYVFRWLGLPVLRSPDSSNSASAARILGMQTTRKQSATVSSFEIKSCSGSKSSATDPLHTNSNEIKVPSGVAAGTPFFANKKSKAAFLVTCFSHLHGRTDAVRLTRYNAA